VPRLSRAGTPRLPSPRRLGHPARIQPWTAPPRGEWSLGGGQDKGLRLPRPLQVDFDGVAQAIADRMVFGVGIDGDVAAASVKAAPGAATIRSKQR
jgi:hypothetical protein